MYSNEVSELRVHSLFEKNRPGAPMTERRKLFFDTCMGVASQDGPNFPSPRQVSLTTTDNLVSSGIVDRDARVNMVINAPGGVIRSGVVLTSGNVAIRVTMNCQPCARGAAYANCTLRQFRTLERFYGVVMKAGEVSSGANVDFSLCRFPEAPRALGARCSWAIQMIPSGRIVTSTELLSAIGADPGYARALSSWMRGSGADVPVHRVLTSKWDVPSWAPDAVARLAEEGVRSDDYRAAWFPLSEAIWFDLAPSSSPD
jgi:alkylated DNA nucleotide flippase Atl1